MSLINQMLQDLDARRAAHGVGVKLPSEIRPLPPAPAARWPWVMAVVVGTAVVAAGAFLFLEQGAHAPYAETVLGAQLPVAPSGGVIASTLPVADSASTAPETSHMPVSPPVPEAVERTPSSGLGADLRIAEVLAEPSRKPGSEKTETDKPLPVAKKDALARPPVSQKNAADVTASPAVPVANDRAVKTVSIEKTEATAQPRDQVEAGYRKAIAAVNQGRVNEALDALQEVLRQDNLHVPARQLRVRLLLDSGRVDDAVQDLREGLLVLPAQTGWAMSLARLQVDRGEIAAAAQTLQYSMPVAAANPDYLGFTAHVLQRLGRHREAADLYQTAARIAPADGRWWLGLGLAMEAEGRNDQAVAAFKRAREAGNLSRELTMLVEQKLR